MKMKNTLKLLIFLCLGFSQAYAQTPTPDANLINDVAQRYRGSTANVVNHSDMKVSMNQMIYSKMSLFGGVFRGKTSYLINYYPDGVIGDREIPDAGWVKQYVGTSAFVGINPASTNIVSNTFSLDHATGGLVRISSFASGAGRNASIQMDQFGTSLLYQMTNPLANGLHSFSVSTGGIEAGSSAAGFSGIRYGADYSANYTDRSLIDRGYLNTRLAGIGGGSAYELPTASTTEKGGIRVGPSLTINSELLNVAAVSGNIVYVSPSGSNANGQRGNIARPYLTLASAITAANVGDVVYVYPGVHGASGTSVGVTKNITVYFAPGAVFNVNDFFFAGEATVRGEGVINGKMTVYGGSYTNLKVYGVTLNGYFEYTSFSSADDGQVPQDILLSNITINSPTLSAVRILPRYQGFYQRSANVTIEDNSKLTATLGDVIQLSGTDNFADLTQNTTHRSTLRISNSVLTAVDPSKAAINAGADALFYLSFNQKNTAHSGTVVNELAATMGDGFSVGSGGGGGVTTLNGLTDVALSSPSTGQVLKFNGTSWANAAETGGSGGTNIDDVLGSNELGFIPVEKDPDGKIAVSETTARGLFSAGQGIEISPSGVISPRINTADPNYIPLQFGSDGRMGLDVVYMNNKLAYLRPDGDSITAPLIHLDYQLDSTGLASNALITKGHTQRLIKDYVSSVSGPTSAIAQQNHTTGTSVTVENASGTIWLIVNPASTLASLTISLPSSPADGQLVQISFGGTLTTGVVVTAVYFSPVPLQASTPEEVEAGESIAYRWKTSTAKWYRIN